MLVCVIARVPLAGAAQHHRRTATRIRVDLQRSNVHHLLRRVHPRSRAVRTRERVARERASIVRYARRFLGVPYTWGGTSPASGFDCSGFTRFVFAHFGVSLPHYTFAQFDRGRAVSRRSLRPGDLVFFDGAGHVGLYIGSGRFIHAPHTGSRVSVARLAGSYSASFDGARRLALG
ncbi:MAG TPA: C40 family peptidase [Gaiellaceae bacterium]